MTDLERTVADNITELRKSRDWTQAELAERIHYSDKSVSKWERGDSLPDLKVLKNMADLFGVTLDYFVDEEGLKNRDKYSQPRSIRGYQIGVTLLAVSLVWLIATIAYTYSAIRAGQYNWVLFVWGVPASMVVLAYFNRKWWKSRALRVVTASVLCWTVLASVYLQFLHLNMWMIFIVGIPAQIAILLWMQIRKDMEKQ